MFQPQFGDKQHLIYRKDEDFSLILQKENDIVFLLDKYLPFSETVWLMFNFVKLKVVMRSRAWWRGGPESFLSRVTVNMLLAS